MKRDTPTIGAMVLYQRHGLGAGAPPVPAVVARVSVHGDVSLCAFTPSPEPVWDRVTFDPNGAPGTWRHLETKEKKEA